MPDPDATWNSTIAPHPPPVAGTGRGPLGVPWGTDRSYSVDIMISAAITAVIGTGFVALRFYTRLVIISVRNWEDWVVLAAQVRSEKAVLTAHLRRYFKYFTHSHHLCTDLFHPHVWGFHPPCGPSSRFFLFLFLFGEIFLLTPVCRGCPRQRHPCLVNPNRKLLTYGQGKLSSTESPTFIAIYQIN